MDAAGGSNKMQLMGWVGIAVSVVSMTAVVIWALRQPAPTLPSDGWPLVALLGALIAYAAATAVRAERWLVLLRRNDEAAPRTDSHGLTVVGYMGNNVLPARGGDLLRVMLMAPRTAMGVKTVLGTIIVEKALDVAVLFALFLLMGYAVLSGVSISQDDRFFIFGGIAIVLAVAGFATAKFAQRRDLFGKARDFLRPLLATARGWGASDLAGIVALTLAVWTLEAATYYAVSLAADASLDPLETLYLVALTGLFVSVPAGPGNVGTLDAGVLLGVHAVGGTSAQALSFLLLLRFVLLVPITVAGLALLVGRYGGWSGMRLAVRSQT